ncbi:MAG: putative RNA polymerase [Prokaryotic dsDNA virus sp.]|nr:MAG: putative RNA polymerase [Prokaryotic dsDNA virus sp.]|tara:strand:- start:43350 stop:45752 length:2403 start_codon:yes stop_codon:yes gene_type:complete
MLDQQIAWEKECLKRGSERYYANQDRLREQGAGDTTDVMSHLIQERLQDTADYLKDLVEDNSVGRNAKYNRVIRVAAQGDYLVLAYLGLKSVLKGIQIPEKNSLMKVTLDIGSRIEADIKCKMFEATKPEYFDVVRKSFAQQNVTDYVHKHKVMMKKFSDFELEWDDWTSLEKVQIGSRVIRAILNTFGDVVFMHKEYRRNKTIYILETTAQFDDWAAEFEKERGLLYPMYLPLKVPPRAWEDNVTGGYYHPSLRMRFIKTKGRDHRQFVEESMPKQHMDAVNKMQRTAWQINEDVLKVQEEIYQKGLGIGMPSNRIIERPPFPEHLREIEKEDLTDEQKLEVRDWKMQAKSSYGRERQRKGQVLAFMQSHKLAKELRQWNKFYFAYSCDFRGRIYCATAGLSPQGADTAKGLLRFQKPVRLGHSGLKWLAIQGANTFGEDKLTYQDRVQWIKSQEPNIRQVVEDPINSREWWGSADKPYQFLAFCYEWARSNYGKNPEAMGHLPVGLDGSCNGLQHFSAMLRDEVGAKATNLIDVPKPEDIYQEVADLTTKKLKKLVNEPENEYAAVWLRVGINRKCAKRPVMTLPYGATRTSAREYIFEYVRENWRKFNLPDKEQFLVANYLTPILWEAIGEVVIAARAAMDWLQKNVGEGYCKWHSPLGFPIFQYYKHAKGQDVKTQIDGRILLKVRDLDSRGEPKKSEQRNGVAPNFVHSIDSSHMVLTINGTKLEDLAMIHDDYGTHAGNTEELFKVIRKSFLYMYSNYTPLHDWGEQVGANMDTIPKEGTYNIKSILDADYFFG